MPLEGPGKAGGARAAPGLAAWDRTDGQLCESLLSLNLFVSNSGESGAMGRTLKPASEC